MSEHGGSRVEMRVGDAERERAVAMLGDHYAAGRLDLEEFDDRLTAAYAARTGADLARLFLDLPAGAPSRLTARPSAARRRATRRLLIPALLVLVILANVVAHILGAGHLGNGGSGYDGPPPLLLLPLLWVWFARRRAWR